MKFIILCLFVFLSLTISSCQKKKVGNQNQSNYSSREISSPFIIEPARPKNNMKESDLGSAIQYKKLDIIETKKLAKNIDIQITTDEVEASYKKIVQFIKYCDGKIETESMDKSENNLSHSLKLFIPSSNIDSFLNKIDSSQVNVVSRFESINDVTMRFIEDSTKISNQKLLESKYASLLSKTNSIKDLLEIEDKLSKIRSEISYQETQFKYLNNTINYCIVSIRIWNKSAAPIENKISDQFVYSINDGWILFKNSFLTLISLWPFAIILTILIFIIKRIRKNKRNKKSS